ncbi:MAG: thioredoxin family protein [Chloroflexaceae bacterium]|nr:thioredoxin family protein [Chloroflexaceae bacterium]
MTALKIGDSLQPFVLPGVDGEQHDIVARYGDKAVRVVVFSCNHCPYVRAWEDRMVQTQADYADRGVQFVVISSNDTMRYPADSFEKMKERATEKQFNFPYLYDETQEVARTYGAERTPEFFVFDTTGTLRYHGTIDDNYENPDAVQHTYLRDALDAVLAGKAPAIAETAPVGCTIKWK